MKDLASISDLISAFTKDSPLNRVEELDNLNIYDEPVVGIASAEDTLFKKLKNDDIIGPNHLILIFFKNRINFSRKFMVNMV